MRGPALALRVGLVLGALLPLCPVGPGPLYGQTPVGSGDVVVTLGAGDSAGVARVEARYVVSPPPSRVELRALGRPCAEIGDVRVERAGRDVPLTGAPDAPWELFRDTTALPGADTLDVLVRYEVRTARWNVDVPLLHLTTPIPQQDGEREGDVRVRVRFGDPSRRVVFPHMTRDSAGEWSGRYVAVPSFVEVTGAAAETGGAAPSASCDAAATPPGSDGGLRWRFWLLVGIMAAWVPLYLWWARRSSEEGA